MSSDPSQLPDSPKGPPETAAEAPGTDATEAPKLSPKQRVLIGSQRDPAAYRRRTKRDWTLLDPDGLEQPDSQTSPEPAPQEPAGPRQEAPSEQPETEPPPPPVAEQPRPAPAAPPVEREPATGACPGKPEPPEPAPVVTAPAEPEPPQPAVTESTPPVPEPPLPPVTESTPPVPEPPQPAMTESTPPVPERPQPATADLAPPPSAATQPAADESAPSAEPPAEPTPGRRFALPNLRRNLSADLAREYDDAVGDVSLEELMAADHEATRRAAIEPDSRQTGRVVHIARDDVFVDLGGREQGIVSLRQFSQAPEPGTPVDVVVNRYCAEEGLYELSLPEMAADVQDWSDLSEGMLVEARVTGHNAGGLECEVNHIRGFIPISQIALYRVEGLEEFVDQKFTCLVTEANPGRRNLVLSRRAVLEKEREDARKDLLDSLEPGEVREGVVRKLMDFGAFVELGSGVDGLLHISQLGWARVEHPRDVLHEGQTIKIKIDKVDKETGRIGLGYREMLENPWTQAATKYPANTLVRGQVTKLMEFGAFVQVEPGVEGLVHISELSHKRVWRTSDVVHEGDEIEVLVLSVDTDAQRMSLSMKQALPEPEPAKKEPTEPGEPAPPPKKLRQKPSEPLKGGLGGPSGGAEYGLRW